MKAFDEIFIDKTKYGVKVQTSEYSELGEHIIIDQGQSQIAGYTDREEGLFEEVPVIVFGDHTRIIKYVDKPFFLGADGVKVLRSKDENANYKYLYYALKNAKIPNTGYNRHFKWLKNIQINYPAVEKQAEIVVILDKVSSVIRKREDELSVLDDLIKARFVEMFGSPVSNPMSWKKQTLKEVCIKLNDGTHFSPESFETGEYKYVTAKNIKLSGFDFSNVTYVPEAVHRPIFSRCNPEFEDVLYIKDGATTGVAIVNTLDEEFTLLSSVALLKQDRTIMNGYFLAALLNNEEMYLDIRNNMGGAAITRLTIAKLNAIKIIVPPIDLQNQFADFVNQIDKSKSAVQKALNETQMLFDSLMQEYFG
jgi:type I restriction enzyme S subunit